MPICWPTPFRKSSTAEKSRTHPAYQCQHVLTISAASLYACPISVPRFAVERAGQPDDCRKATSDPPARMVRGSGCQGQAQRLSHRPRRPCRTMTSSSSAPALRAFMPSINFASRGCACCAWKARPASAACGITTAIRARAWTFRAPTIAISFRRNSIVNGNGRSYIRTRTSCWPISIMSPIGSTCGGTSVSTAGSPLPPIGPTCPAGPSPRCGARN